MKEHRDGSWSDKPVATIKSHMTVPWFLARRAVKTPNDVCIGRRTEVGASWVKITAAEFESDVIQAAHGLIGLGLKPGEAISIFGVTSYEWSLLNMAALYAGLTVVPIHESSSAEQICWIVSDTDVRPVLTDSATHAVAADSVKTSGLMPTLVYGSDSLQQPYAAGSEIDEARVLERKNALAGEDTTTVIYTSGTTGNPKGVELTHGNIATITMSALAAEGPIIDSGDNKILFFLSLTHVMARVVSHFAVAGRGRVARVPNVKHLLTDIQSFEPSALLCVSWVLEKVYGAAEAKMRGLRLKIFRWAAHVAIRNPHKRFHGPLFLLQRVLARALVWKKITAALGSSCRYAISAGAPLGKWLGHFYRGIGLSVIEAFGLTETSGPFTANRPGAFKIGTVGQPLPGTAVKITDDGEVLLKGPHTFRGYHSNPSATSETFEKDWFRTDDVGAIDKNGFLSVTGRKRELIVTAGGKNVASAVLEDKLHGHPPISQVVAVGDKRPLVAALIALDANMFPGWLRGHGLPHMDTAFAARHPVVLEALQRAVDRANEQALHAESTRKFTVVNGDFTEENGLLTPSMKVKRADVPERHADVVEGPYTDPPK